MGIPELWKTIGEGEIVPLARLSEDHFQRNGRPLRIAIDEAGWRFNNLTQAQVYAIRDKSNEPAYNGIEKNLFYRLCRLLKLNIQPFLIFDGTHRPWKNGGPSGRIDYDRIRLVKELLRVLRVPYHEAPSEAEAECVRLQQAGIVDAVWSEDSDALMFGCTFLIRDFRVQKTKEQPSTAAKENTQKSAMLVRVTRSKDLLQGLDRKGLVLFAVLVGGDYNRTGLRGCGPTAALRAAKHGLGRSLCQCRRQISHFPQDFPRLRDVKNYNCPKVSTDEQVHNLRGLRAGWERPLDEAKLLKFTSERFNIWFKGYLNWIGPILLARSLTSGVTGGFTNPHQVKVKKTRAKKGSDDAPNEPPLETTITFSAFDLTSLNISNLERGMWAGDVDVPFDSEHRVDCELMTSLLRKGLPPEIFDPPAPKPKKVVRKRKTGGGRR